MRNRKPFIVGVKKNRSEAGTRRKSKRIHRLVQIIIGQRLKKGGARSAFWSSRPSEYEGIACAQIRGRSAQSPTDLT